MKTKWVEISVTCTKAVAMEVPEGETEDKTLDQLRDVGGCPFEYDIDASVRHTARTPAEAEIMRRHADEVFPLSTEGAEQ